VIKIYDFKKVLEYENKLMDLEVNNNQDQVFYFLENPNELSSRVKEFSNLRTELFGSTIPNRYRESMLGRVNEQLNYLNRILRISQEKEKKYLPFVFLSLLMGIGIGAVGVKKFENLIENSGKRSIDIAIKEFFKDKNLT